MTPNTVAAILKDAKEKGIMPMCDPEESTALLNSRRPRIRLPGDNRELGEFAHEVGAILSKQLYRRGTLVVRVNKDAKRTDPVEAEWLRTGAEYHLVCFKERSVSNGHLMQVVKTMNLDTARGTLVAEQFLSQLKPITRLNPIRLPIMTRNGRIELAPLGYCEETGVFTLENEVICDEEMTSERAKEVIRAVLREFPFSDSGRSLAVQIAAMLTVFAVGILPPTAAKPGFLYTANDSDAGKTLAAKVAIIPVFGCVNTRGFPRKEEARKVLDQIAMSGAATVLFDNVKGTLGGEEIEAFMSAARWSGRILGEKGGFDVENVTICFFTGNDAKPTRDMANRCLFVELFLEQTDSSARKIERPLNDRVLSEVKFRSELCSAMWALVKDWDGKGRPRASVEMAKAEEWSHAIGAIVEAAGFGAVCERPKTAVSGFHRDMELLIRALYSQGADGHRWEFRELLEVVKAEDLFVDGSFFAYNRSDVEIYDKDGEMTSQAKNSLGNKLAAFGKVEERASGRVVAAEGGGKLRFKVEGKGHGRRYIVSLDQ